MALSESFMAICWKHKSLLWELVRRDLQNRYSGSVAGWLWVLLHPLALLALYGLVFEAIFKVKMPDLQLDQPYVLFVAVVLWPWLAFSESLIRGTGAILNHAALVKKVALPHELLVCSAVLSVFVVHCMGYALVMTVLALMGMQLHWAGLWFSLLLLPALLLMALALALVLSSLQVFIRDVEQILSQVLGVLFYATPVLFQISMVPDWLGRVMAWNPLAHITEPLRRAWLGTAGGSQSHWIIEVLIVWLFVVCGVWLARKVFRRLSPYFEDMV